MDKRDIGQEILDGVREIKAYKAGKGDLRVRTLSVPESPRVIRERLHLSQAAFAGMMGVSLRTVQDWEAEKRELPEYLLRLMKYRAEVEDMMKNKS